MAGERGGIRLRTTLTATAVVGVAMAVGAVALVSVLRTTLTGEVRAAALLRAAEVAADPGPLPAEEDTVVQVLDAGGRVVAATPALAGLPPLTPGDEVLLPFDDDPFLVVADRRVRVGRSLDPVVESSQVVTGLLGTGLPVLLLVVAATTWRVVGRALAPVEAIRREVDAVSAAQLHRRVPDPRGDDEIGRLARTMNRMLGRLEQSHRRQRRFVADASHELRSPVASIRQHAEVAIAHPERTTTADLARTVLADGLRVQRLVEDLLLLARADEHTLELRRRPVDLDDLVFDEARRLRTETDLRVDTRAVSAGRVDGDADDLRRVLRNLGENAARHARGRVRFGLAEREGRVRLAVDDDGRGIPPADRERVLERFVRLDEARTRDGGGSGLGLAIVAEVTAAHGGTVRVGASELGGARVELELPGP